MSNLAFVLVFAALALAAAGASLFVVALIAGLAVLFEFVAVIIAGLSGPAA